MPLTIQSSQGTVTAYLQGEIDHHSATAIREEIDSYLTGGQVSLLILDFGGVTFMDSSGIGLVMGRYRQMEYQGGALQLVNTPPQIYKVMRIAGLHKLATIERAPQKEEEENKGC